MHARVRTLVLGILVCVLAAPATMTAQSAFPVNFEAIRKAVVFIYARGADGRTQPDGTGFLIGIPSKAKHNRQYVFLVTARHIVDPAWTGCPPNNQGIVARFNKKVFDPNVDASGTVDYQLPGDISKGFRWISPMDDSADIAFIMLNAGQIDAMGGDYNVITLNEFPSADELEKMDTGSQILSAGLFPGASGKKRNYPIFKFGYVSSRPQEKMNYKACPTGREISSTQWMIAASLVPGNSGSPIFFAPIGFGDITFNGGGRAVVIGVQSTSFQGWNVAGMAPIQALIDSLKTLDLPDLDLSGLGSTAPAAPAGKTR
jgi:hypothetical protein